MVLGATAEMPFLDSWVTLLWTNTEAAEFMFSCTNYEERCYFMRDTLNLCILKNYLVVIC